MQKSLMSFPTFETDRLLMRAPSLADEKEIFLLRTDESVNTYIQRKKPTTTEEARKFILDICEGISNGRWFYWAICLKDSGLIGTIGLSNLSIPDKHAELGYELLPRFQGRGFMQEAVEKVIHFGFESLKLERIEACTSARNFPSLRLLERNHFKRNTEAEIHLTEEERTAHLQLYSLDRQSFG